MISLWGGFLPCEICGYDFVKTKTIGHACPGALMNPNKPEPAPRGMGREITPLVIEDLKLRSKLGTEKYGETLRAFNGRNPLVDAYQEVLDLAQYLRQRLAEADNSEDPDTNYMTRVNDAQKYKIPVVNFSGLVNFSGYTLDDLRTSTTEGCSLPLEDTIQGSCSRESIAQEAHRLVLGDRGEAYGHPIFDMTRSADMLTALLRDKLVPGMRLEAEDIGAAMICVKQSRHRNTQKRDNLVDTAGYALTLQMIAEWRAANPGEDPRDHFVS